MSLAVVILTLNEERHLRRLLPTLRQVADQIFVVDSFSSDGTVEVARSNGATVLQNRFVNHAKQFAWALENAPISCDWVMRLDADEILEPSLITEISQKLPNLPADVVGVNLKRKHIFLGKWVRHGGRYPLLLLRIWRRGHGQIEDRWMDEHIVVSGGKTVVFDGGFSDWNLNDLTFFIDKHNRYATREAIDVLGKKYRLFDIERELSNPISTPQTAVKRMLKENFYNKIPFQFGAVFYFLYRYFLLLGFLDGAPGLIYHFLQGCWYRFLVGARIFELEKEIAHLSDPSQIRAELTRLTGLKVELN
jgi:glycosyltransferase involved in cell wall biosynthesis